MLKITLCPFLLRIRSPSSRDILVSLISSTSFFLSRCSEDEHSTQLKEFGKTTQSLPSSFSNSANCFFGKDMYEALRVNSA
jgi:hypothetical protein